MITQKDIDSATMHINGTNIADFGVLVGDLKVGGMEIQSQIYQGVKRTNFNVLSMYQYMRPITVNLFYSAPTRRELALIKSKIDNMLMGKLDLWLPDGFYYFAYLINTGEEKYLGVDREKVIAMCTYQLKGIRHDPLVTVHSTSVDNYNEVICTSTVPQTDCRLSFTSTSSYGEFVVDTVTLSFVNQDDVIVVDGINGRILRNGAPYTGGMSFIHFPSLKPDKNELYCKQNLTIEYYPTY